MRAESYSQLKIQACSKFFGKRAKPQIRLTLVEIRKSIGEAAQIFPRLKATNLIPPRATIKLTRSSRDVTTQALSNSCQILSTVDHFCSRWEQNRVAVESRLPVRLAEAPKLTSK
jgi:hypothetical protein